MKATCLLRPIAQMLTPGTTGYALHSEHQHSVPSSALVHAVPGALATLIGTLAAACLHSGRGMLIGALAMLIGTLAAAQQVMLYITSTSIAFHRALWLTMFESSTCSGRMHSDTSPKKKNKTSRMLALASFTTCRHRPGGVAIQGT